MRGQPHTRSPKVHALSGNTIGPTPGTIEGMRLRRVVHDFKRRTANRFTVPIQPPHGAESKEKI